MDCLLVPSLILWALNHDVAMHVRPLLCLPVVGCSGLESGMFITCLLPLVHLCTDNKIFTSAGTG